MRPFLSRASAAENYPWRPGMARVSAAAALSENTSAASRLWAIVAAVKPRFFCAYCLSVRTDATQINSQINVIVISTLIILIRRSVRLNVGLDRENSLFMLLISCKH
ncbi:Uncharacterised protein [Salmonella enterica subsp. arizonae]|nr:Uncharacterised protein [Salmonella enterica subsp. arizonae]